MRPELLIALRYSFTKQKEKFVSIINTFAVVGIALGVATLIIVMSVMNGYEKELLGKVLGFKGHMTITTTESKLKNWSALQQMAQEKIPEALAVTPIAESQGLCMSENSTTGVVIKGMIKEDIWQKVAVVKGEVTVQDNCEGLILGNSLDRGMQHNGRVKIIIPKFNETMIGTMPRMKTYNVCGTFDVGMHDYNSGVIFMNLSDAQTLLKLGTAVSGLEITLRDLNDLPRVKHRLVALLREDNFDNKDLVIVDWQQANKSLVDVLRVERTVMFLILSLIILIAVFNIISSLMLLVHDKIKEIAILRTIGMTKSSVVSIFIMCGSTVGMIGTVLGTILGIVFSLNIEKIKAVLESISGIKLFDPVIYFLTTLPSDLKNEQVISVVLISLSLSLIATIYPAWRVSKISPAQILRY